MKNSLCIAIGLILFSSCATKNINKTIQPEQENISDYSKAKSLVSKVDRNHNKSESLGIHGSAKINNLSGQANHETFFLYGAEHLKLKNNYFDFPVVYNAAVKKWINYFARRGKDYFVRYSERSGRYAPVLGKILESMGLPRDLIFLAMAESGFQNKAKSWAKAVGPWQFMSYTGRRYGLEINWYIDERRDPIKATIAAGKYLQYLHDLFDSWELAAAGYNAGEGKMMRAIKRYKTKNFWEIRKGRYLKRETKEYVPKIMALAIIGKNLSSFGFDEIDFHEPLDFDEVDVPGNSDLYLVSKAMDLPVEELFYLNPEILRWQTPPSKEPYKLRVPVGGKAVFASCCSNMSFEADKYQVARVRRSTSLTRFAKKHRVPANVVSSLNGVSTKKYLRSGQELILPFREGQSRKDSMYADLYEKPRKSVLRRRKYRKWITRAYRSGQLISNPSEYYIVKRGDTLWNVAQKTGVPLSTIVKTNYNLIKNRMIRAGDRLAIR